MLFFKEEFPKTTGPELFNMAFLEDALLSANIGELSAEDLINTATQFTAQAIADAVKKRGLKTKNFTVYISGGGANNSYLIELLSANLSGNKILNIIELKINADAKEAVLFAVLANETICGSVLDTGAGPKVMMGKVWRKL